jgi:NitT/TauT family transport system ATP-binding protein
MGLAHEGGQLLVVLAKLSQHVVRRDIVGVIVGALDAQTKILMGYELVRLWTDHRKSVVFVTHWMRSGCPIASWS